ncbi:hypothetical protein SLEP1_g42764 [Rubroshorea leprosula]|uniref:Uncharacterized protein n=1 Tax=Rubroshorea leprosula TaxID=152421 RepID=A0AAV5LBV3_9ROSI|nr:hypothetical protein SLEP1_g42764 [Rubroshorea leprosula]
MLLTYMSLKFQDAVDGAWVHSIGFPKTMIVVDRQHPQLIGVGKSRSTHFFDGCQTEVDMIDDRWSLGSLNWVDFCHGDLQIPFKVTFKTCIRLE